MKPIYLLIYFIFITEILLNAQNLINNSEFDNYTTFLDSNNNLVYQPDYWYYDTKTLDHPIYYSSDRFLNKSLINNFHPDSMLIKLGQKVNFISIFILPNTQTVYTTLKEQLKEGQKYHLIIDIKAFEQSNCISDLLVGFKECLNCTMDSSLYQLQLKVPDSLTKDFLSHNWLTLKADFIAVGKERVLALSSGSSKDYIKILNSNRNRFKKSPDQGSLRLKYYIDNVKLTAINCKNDNMFLERMDSLNLGESIVLQNIYFDFDKYELLKESFPVLEKVIYYLNKNKNIGIQVIGYTDNLGTKKYNDELSEKRSESVVNYLINKGIVKERLQSLGFGAKFPIASNVSEEGRQKNRRIEIKIIAK